MEKKNKQRSKVNFINQAASADTGVRINGCVKDLRVMIL